MQCQALRSVSLVNAVLLGNSVLHLMAGEYESAHDRGSLVFLLEQGADKRLRNHGGLQAWQCLGRKHKTAVALLKPV